MPAPPIAAIANLCDDVLQRLRSDYHTLSSEQLFRALGTLRPSTSEGELPPDPGPLPSGGADALLPHLEAWLQRFIAERAADMPWEDVNAALGGIGAEFDRLRRSGELSGAARRLDAATPRRSSTSAAPEPVNRNNDRDEAAAPPQGRARWVRTGVCEFECVWSSESQRAELSFASSEELGRFALALREGPSVAMPLDPPPVEHSALRLMLRAKGEEKSHTVMGHVVSTGAETRLRVDALPSPLGRLAQRALEARIRATRIATARAPSLEDQNESVGAESGASRPTRAVARGSRGSSRSAAPPPIAPKAFERTPSTRTPTSEQYLADRTSSRRRRAAARRASGTQRARSSGVDGLSGAPPARGARSAAEAHALKSTSKRRRNDVYRPAAPDAEQRLSDAASAGTTSAVSAAAERATAPLRAADAPRETTPLRGAGAPRDTAPLHDEASPSSDSVSRPPPPTREIPVARSEDGASASTAPEGRTENGFVHTDSWSRKRTPLSVRRRPPAFEPSFGEELGTMSGEATEGGPAAVMLALASDFPAVSIVMLVAGARWRMLIREDVLLDVRQEPEDPRFDIVRLVRDSGLCEVQDLHDALEAAEQNEVTLLEQLGRERLLRYREIDAIQGSRVKTMLSYLGTARLDRWEAVGFDFVEFSGSSPVEFAADAWRSVIAAVEALPMSQVESALAKHMAARPKYRHSARLTPRALHMSAKEKKFVDAVLNGEQSIRQSVARSPLRRRASLCIVLALDRIGMIEWEHVDARSARVSRAMPEIIDRLKSVEGLNPFARLDAHWSSDEVLVLEAWRDAVRSFDLAFVLEHATGEDLEAAKRLHEALCGARDGLRTRPQREEARAQLCDAFERGAATQLYEKQAELSLFKKDVRLAADALRRVVELDPKNAKATRQLGVIRRLDDSL